MPLSRNKAVYDKYVDDNVKNIVNWGLSEKRLDRMEGNANQTG